MSALIQAIAKFIAAVQKTETLFTRLNTFCDEHNASDEQQVEEKNLPVGSQLTYAYYLIDLCQYGEMYFDGILYDDYSLEENVTSLEGALAAGFPPACQESALAQILKSISNFVKRTGDMHSEIEEILGNAENTLHTLFHVQPESVSRN